MSRGRHIAALALAAIFLANGTQAAAQPGPPAPETKIAEIFTEPNRARLCGTGRDGRTGPTVRPDVLIGELMVKYGINPFALPPNPDLRGRPIPDRVEARAAAWIIEAADAGQARRLGLASRDHMQLNLMREALADYLWWARDAPQGPLYRTVATPLAPAPPPLPGQPPETPDEVRRERMLLALFEPVLGISPEERLVLACPRDSEPAPTPGPPPVRVATPTGPSRTAPAPGFTVRGQIDDLAARRGTADFKKASSATLAFTDNNQAGTTSFAINGVLGYGASLGNRGALFGFVQYTLNDQETDAPGDNDDAKDIHNISPGLFYRNPTRIGHSIYGTLGLTAYATFDLRNDAQLLRARLVYSNFSVRLGAHQGFLCGQERVLAGALLFDCRLSAFVEAAEVLEAGTNTDLLSNIDDEYLGIGGEAGIILSPQGPDFLRPISLRATYRRMQILSGALDDPWRWELALAYSSPAAQANRQSYSLGLSYVRGANFETFQQEDLWKLSLGLKF